MWNFAMLKKISVLQIANVVALVVTLIMNVVAQSSLVPNTVGALGESRAIFFLPAGYVFAIWGLIYTGLIIYAIYQVRPSETNADVVRLISWWFVLSCIANISWLLLFVYDLVELSTIAMLVLLLSLIMIYIRLRIGLVPVTSGEKWAVHLPFSIYLGWVSVATISNFAATFYALGSDTTLLYISADFWAVVMLIVAAALAFMMLYFRGDIAYALVIVWATYGIYARPFDTDLYSRLSSQNITLVNTTALTVAIIIGIAALARFAHAFRQ